jgi:alpha-glucosidase (family GH31 glycosyl hydrolase)
LTCIPKPVFNSKESCRKCLTNLICALTWRWLIFDNRDLDYLYLNRDFTHNANYAVDEGREFLARLHANGQYWMPILDPNIYVPDPTNASDAYGTYDRGKALDLYIKNGDEDYIGAEWPGFSVWPDFTADTSVQQYWTDEFKRYFEQLEYDGWWLDISDAPSWCTGSCGTGRLAVSVYQDDASGCFTDLHSSTLLTFPSSYQAMRTPASRSTTDTQRPSTSRTRPKPHPRVPLWSHSLQHIPHPQ